MQTSLGATGWRGREFWIRSTVGFRAGDAFGPKDCRVLEQLSLGTHRADVRRAVFMNGNRFRIASAVLEPLPTVSTTLGT